MNYRLLLVILLFVPITLFSQQNKINPDGYNVFYYPNGVKSSEGYMKDGKPDGYWINYYPDGVKKSEGKRTNFLLDSVWIFYAQTGDTSQKITYYLGKKNGWYITYYTHLDSGFVANVPKSKVMYVNGKREGKAYFYYPDGKLHKVINYKDNYAHGLAFEYAPDGRIITVITYSYGNPIEADAINRYDSQGKKHGLWREYYPNGQIKWEATYSHGKLNGYYKEYSPYGALVKYERYKNGKLLQLAQKNAKTKAITGNLQLIEEYYPDGKLKHVGTYSDTIPVGIHRYYSESGKLDSAVWYGDLGQKLGTGMVDSLGHKTGKWTLFYDDGKIMAIGKYQNDKRTGEWTFFYKNGQILQKGYYSDGQPDGQWLLYYKDGNLLREENYIQGIHNGKFYELTDQGDTIISTNYTDGQPDGRYYLQVGDIMQTGNYDYGQKTGTWKTYYYPEKRLMCVDNYEAGARNGKHVCYYDNGRVKEQGQYLDGQKNGTWYYYTPAGYLIYTITYRLDEPVKIDGKKTEAVETQ